MASEELQYIDPKQLQAWQMQGHEPVYERGVVRLAKYRKSFPKDLEVTVLDPADGQYKPLILSCGRPLLVSECMPERADLALDEEGHLISQGEFAQRYDEYLNTFMYPQGADVSAEPVPNVVDYIKKMQDPWGESAGMVEVGFDAKLDEEFRPKQRFGPNGETEEEWRERQGESNREFARELVREMLAAQRGEASQPEIKPEPEAAPEAESPGLDAAQAAASTSAEGDREQMPCGVWKKRGYRAQHMRHCNHELCGGPGVNAKDDDG